MHCFLNEKEYTFFQQLSLKRCHVYLRFVINSLYWLMDADLCLAAHLPAEARYTLHQLPFRSHKHTSAGTMMVLWSGAIVALCCRPASTLCCCEWGAHSAALPGCLRVMWEGWGCFCREERKWEIGATARELSLSDAAPFPAAPCQL